MAAVAIFGGGAATGLAALFRIRGQGRMDSATARKTDAEAEKTEAEADAVRVNAYAALWEKVNGMEAEYARKLSAESACYQAGIESVRAELLADIKEKDNRLKRLESDVITLKQKLGEWRAYAMGLYHMLVALRPDQTPPPPPDTGPLKP